MQEGKPEYLKARTFALSFPSYYDYLFDEVDAVRELITKGKIPVEKGSRLTSRNRVIQELATMGLASRGNKEALRRVTRTGLGDACLRMKEGELV